jgi:hypothetical protein
MLSKVGIILSLALALVFSPGMSPQCQARPSRKLLSIENVMRPIPPLVKITPRSDGKFVLEPLAPPPKTPISPPFPPTQKGESSDRVPPTSQKYNPIQPWDLGHLVLSRVRQARYAWGASLENGSATDCSGFTRYIYRMCNIDLPRTSAEQAQLGQEVTRRMNFSRMEPGDLLFFRDSGRAVGHAGIYLGEGKMIHATRSGGGVMVSELDQGYYVNNFVVAKRVFEKTYKWAAHPGLNQAARNRDWDISEAIPASLPSPLPVISSKLLKIFWPVAALCRLSSQD